MKLIKSIKRWWPREKRVSFFLLYFNFIYFIFIHLSLSLWSCSALPVIDIYIFYEWARTTTLIQSRQAWGSRARADDWASLILFNTRWILQLYSFESFSSSCRLFLTLIQHQRTTECARKKKVDSTFHGLRWCCTRLFWCVVFSFIYSGCCAFFVSLLRHARFIQLIQLTSQQHDGRESSWCDKKLHFKKIAILLCVLLAATQRRLFSTLVTNLRGWKPVRQQLLGKILRKLN